MTNFSQKKWLVTILFCFFFGFAGIHSFYVGRIGRGIFQLLTLGGLGIWSLIDLLTLMYGNFQDSESLPLEKPPYAPYVS